MSQIKKFGMAAATFSAALGIGFAMQNGGAVAARFGPAPEETTIIDTATLAAAPAVEVVLTDAPQAGPVLMQPVLASVADPLPTPAVQSPVSVQAAPAPMALVGLDDPAVAPNLTTQDAAPALASATLPAAIETVPAIEEAMPEAAAVDCAPVMTGIAAPAAMVDLTLTAPCNPSAEFVLHHQGMMISGITDADGGVRMMVPALGETAVFVAAFADQVGALATVEVPELALFDRAVLQWQGDVGVQMQVYEFGAAFGSDGHVSMTAPRDMDALTAGQGYMVAVGMQTGVTEPYLAQVYTYPAGTAAKDGTILVSVEAEITNANCGRDIAAQSIQITPGAAPNGQDLTMTMPACDGIGDLMVLDTMFQEFTVASN